MDGGWFRLWRKVFESAVFLDADPWLFKVFMWCVGMARHQDSVISGGLKAGQFHIGQVEAAMDLGLSYGRFRRLLARLRDMECIRIDSSNKRTTITICNYSTYQSKSESNEQPVNNERTTSGHPVDNLPLEEECKNGKNHGDIDSTFSEPAKRLAFIYRSNLRGRKPEDMTICAEAFEEMLAIGATEESLTIDLRRRQGDRDRSEFLWEIKNRAKAALGLGNGKKTNGNLKQAAQEAYDWANERDLNEQS